MKSFYFLNLLFIISFDLSTCHNNFDYSFPKLKERQGGSIYPFIEKLDQGNVQRAGHHVVILNERLASEIYCSGSLYLHRFVITSASCLKSRKHKHTVYMLNDHERDRNADWSLDFSNAPAEEDGRKIIAKHVHRKYNPFTFQNDIAIIVLSEPVDSFMAASVELPNHYIHGAQQQPDENILVTLTGFESTDVERNTPYIVEMETLTNRDCQYQLNEGSKTRFLQHRMICARTCPHNAGIGAPGPYSRSVINREDLGAGLIQTDEEGRRIIVGITSNFVENENFDKGHFPAVFTRVSYYRHWIEKIVEKY